MLSLYFYKAVDMKPKVIRQVLMTIVRFVTGVLCPYNEVVHVVNELVESATFISLSLIYSKGERSSARAAMNLCEIFLTKQLVATNILYQAIAKARDLLEGHESCDNSEVSDIRMPPSSILSSSLIGDLVATLIAWVQYPDTAPSAGRLLKCLFIHLQNNSWQDLAHGELQEEKLSLWVIPLKETLHLHPELLEAVGNHVLPGLLQIDYAESLRFLNSLPLSKLQGSDLTSVPEEDIQFCLSIVSILRKKGLDQLLLDVNVSIPGNVLGVVSASAAEAEAQTLSRGLDVDKFSTRLLVHGNSNISIASLSVLTASSSVTKPFSEKTLASLEQNLPSFHAESDSKFRGEFLSVMRKVLRRLDNALSRMLHRPMESTQTNDSIITSWDNQFDDQYRKGNAAIHLSFVRWYIGYLEQELQPTASYQRHIIALKILQIMRKSSLLETFQVSSLSPSIYTLS